MSYILDALRRAEAERERGAVPSLQSQQHTIIEDDAAVARPRSLVWAVVVLALALIAALAWRFLAASPEPARVSSEGVVSSPPAPLPGTTFPPAPPIAQQQPASPPPAPAPAGAAPTLPGTAEPAPVPRARAAPARQPIPALADGPTHALSRQGAATATPKQGRGESAPTPSAPSAEGRVYATSELPEEIRRDLPKVVIGGSSYSGDAASRMVMVNGQVFHEGDRLAPGLVLERIRLKSAVLSFKGWRYEVVF